MTDQPNMTRAQLADAIWEGRLSIAEAEDIDPTLKGVRALFGISDEEAQQRHDLSQIEPDADADDGEWADDAYGDPHPSDHGDDDGYGA